MGTAIARPFDPLDDPTPRALRSTPDTEPLTVATPSAQPVPRYGRSPLSSASGWWCLILILLGWLPVSVHAEPAPPLSCRQLARLAEEQFRIPSPLFEALVMTESSNNPYAIHVNGTEYQPKTRAEAIRILKPGIAEKADVGCGQISMRYHRDRFGSPIQALDPVINILYSASFLLENYQRYGDWTKAIAYYHSSIPSNQKTYLCRVATRVEPLLGLPSKPCP